jgi:hypothetical protein
VLLLGTLLLLGVGPGCGGGGAGESVDTEAGPLATAWIGAEGGVVEVTTGPAAARGMRIVVPAGAVPEPTRFSVSLREEPSGAQPVFELEPAGVDFAVPVELELPFSEEVCDADRFFEALSVLSYSPDDGSWRPVPFSQIDADAKTLTCSAGHFSDFKVHADRFVHETGDLPDRMRWARTVVLIHGVQLAKDEDENPRGDCDETFGRLKALLRDRGFDVWSFEYATAQWLEYSAGNFGLGLQRIWKQKVAAGYDEPEGIAVIAHSMGGLVCRTYMQDLAVEARRQFYGWTLPRDWQAVVYKGEVDTLVMLGTPNYGSHAALGNALWDAYNHGALDPTKPMNGLMAIIKGSFEWASIQMTPGSAFLNLLNERDSFFDLPKAATYHCIYGTKLPLLDTGLRFDGVVTEDSARLGDWEDDPEYEVRAYGIEVLHSPVLGSLGIARIDSEGHPSWPLILHALNVEGGPIRNIDFESFPSQSGVWTHNGYYGLSGPNGGGPAVYEEDGCEVSCDWAISATNEPELRCWPPTTSGNPTSSHVVESRVDPAVLRLRRSDHRPFRLASVDLSFRTYGAPWSLRFLARRAGGDVVSQTIPAATDSAWRTYDLTPLGAVTDVWWYMSLEDLTAAYHQFDNLVVMDPDTITD